MKAVESKQQAQGLSPAWAWAYAAAAVALACVMALVWWQEGRRPWQEEVRAINQQRGAGLKKRLIAAGMDPARAEERASLLAEEPPRIREVTPSLTGRPERCLTCHQGLEEISPSHPVEAVGCVICHGGRGLGLSKELAHGGLRGRNPAALATAKTSCGGGGQALGKCHSGRSEPSANMVYRVERTIMATMAGVLTSLRAAWGAQGDFATIYGAIAVSDPLRPLPAPPLSLAGLMRIPGGKPQRLGFAGLADEHWRKFCARCHLHAQRPSGPSVHGKGCQACHGRRNQQGFYKGQDACIPRDEPGHAALHRLEPAPPEQACRRCHNRSGRIGLNYRGWMEDENGRVPWPAANPLRTLSGHRSVRKLLPDAHAQKGMTCIDCHTPMEVMGDGRIYGRMRHQTEVRCQSCHGGPQGPPDLAPADNAVRYEVSYGPLKNARPLTPGVRLALSAKQRPLAAVRRSAAGLELHLRSKPKTVLPCPLVNNEPGHKIPGHKRLSCQACHSRWTPQCFGCHDYRRPDQALWDYGKGAPTPGRWQETRDIYRFREPLLGVDSRGKITPFVPGCQVLLTVLDAKGRPQKGMRAKILRKTPAGTSIASTPIAPHTTQKEVRPCEGCHMNHRALGLGSGPVSLGSGRTLALAGLKPLGLEADLDALATPEGKALQGTTHQGARPLNRQEIKRVLGFARCLPCHRKPEDPVVMDPGKAYERIGPGGDLHGKHRLMEQKALQ